MPTNKASSMEKKYFRKEVFLDKELYSWILEQADTRNESKACIIDRLLNLGRLYLESGHTQIKEDLQRLEQIVVALEQLIRSR